MVAESNGRIAFWCTIAALGAAVAWPAFLWAVPGFISTGNVDDPLMLVLAAPVVVALVAWAGLHARCSRGSTVGFVVAAALVGPLYLLTIVGMASIGFLMFPAATLLVVAVATTPDGSPATA